MNYNWTFAEPENLAVFTTAKILSRTNVILYVLHDDEGDWQFQSGNDIHEDEPKVVALSEIVDLDSSILDLADLPMGMIATRKSKDDCWQISIAKDVTNDINA
jgi:hypothetical protein